MNPAPVMAFSCPVKTNSGDKALEHLPVELAGLNAFRPVIITSEKAVGRKAVRTLTGAFGDSGMTLGFFDAVPDDADLDLIDQLKINCIEKQYDAVIALGGGVITDTAKVLNLAVSLKVVDAGRLSGETPIRKHLLPLVVVPTAAATGLEASKLVHLNRTVFSSEFLAPDLVVLDPRLTSGNDGKQIAATGLAALGRALEAHIGADKNPFRNAYSFAAICFIRENLLAAVADPRDRKASLAVANAATMSGCAFSNADDALLHKLGQVFYDIQPIQPGIIMAMCMPHVLLNYRDGDRHDLSALLHPLAGDDEFARTPIAKRTDAALAALGRFLADLQGKLGNRLPRTLREAGVPRYGVDDILEALGTDRDGPFLRAVVERIWGDKPGT